MLPYHIESPIRQLFRLNPQEKIEAGQLYVEMACFRNGGSLPRASMQMCIAWAFTPNRLVRPVSRPLMEYSAPLAVPPPIPARSGTVCVPVPDGNHNLAVAHGETAVVHQSGEHHTFVGSSRLKPVPSGCPVVNASPTTGTMVNTAYMSPPPGPEAYTTTSWNFQYTLHGDNATLNQDLKDMLVKTIHMLSSQGTEATIARLLEHGAEDPQSATAVATVMDAMRREPWRTSSGDFYYQLRRGGLAMFKKHWNIVRSFIFRILYITN
jgi:hypothetical protein